LGVPVAAQPVGGGRAKPIWRTPRQESATSLRSPGRVHPSGVVR